MTTPEFESFPKISRFSREVIVTEKIDGTNAQVWISDDGSEIMAGSRSRWITPEKDNFGFARWVQDNSEELLKLGPGRHFGEWWGQGIQRGYGLTEKRFSLFNVSRWNDPVTRPTCCHAVPIIDSGLLHELDTNVLLERLSVSGSLAAPGFMKPEGIVLFHVPSRTMFKRTIEKDESYKGES